MTPYKLVFTTCANQQEATHISHALIEQKLAACVNILPQVESVYLWQGKVETSTESKLIIKTHQALVTQLINKLKQLHSYDVAEIQVVDVSDGNQAYFNWMNEVIR